MLLPYASSIAAADERLAPLRHGGARRGLVAALPDDWLPARRGWPATQMAQRRAYVAYLTTRLEARAAFVEEADRARAAA